MRDLTVTELKEIISTGCSIIDLRSSQDFASGFIPGSIFFSEEVTIRQFSSFINQSVPIILIFSGRVDDSKKTEALLSTGLKIEGVYKGTIDAWKAAGNSIDLVIQVEADELSMDLRFDKKMVLVDLRDRESFMNAHVQTAANIPLYEIADVAQVAALDERGCVYLYEKGDDNAFLAASWMKKLGVHNLRVVCGGWRDIVKDNTITIEKASRTKNNEMK